MPPFANLVALATAVPPYRLDQDAVAALAGSLFGDAGEFARLRPVFDNAGVRRRFAPARLGWFEESRGFAERNRLYVAAALDLLERVAVRALDASGTPLEDVGAVVTVSTTGIATPSLDARLIERLPLHPDVQRLPIFGLGCAGGAIGLARAAAMARMMPEKAVLFLVVELCTLAFRPGDASKSNVIGAALFGDGAAAAVLRCGGEGPAIVATGEHTWPDSLDLMGWDVTDDGLRAVFSRDIPALVRRGLGNVAAEFLARQGLTVADIDRVVCHPGGPKVIEACEEALGLPTDSLVEARRVLREFGNMSAATVLFVLREVLSQPWSDAGAPWRRALMTAFGPGFSVGFVLLCQA